MVRWADSPLNQAQAHVVERHWDDLVRHLARPAVAWEWIESDLEPRTKHRLKKEDLVESVAGGRWRATSRLWRDVNARADDDEEIGRASSGQELLADPVGEERESRVLGQSPSLPLGESMQQTFTGDTVEIDNDDAEDRFETNLEKAENGPEYETEVAPGQVRLAFFDAGQTTLSAWTDILGARDRGAA